MGEMLIGQDPRAIGRIEALLYSFTRTVTGGLNSNAAGAILNACLDIKGKALGVPVYELFGGAVRDRMPVYWSRCGVIRARCADYFDGKVIDKPAVRTVDDLKAAAREARDRGYKAVKDQPAGVRPEGRPPIHAGLLARAGLSRAQSARGDARRAHRPAHGGARGRRPQGAHRGRSQLQLQGRRLFAASPRRSSRST